MAAPIKVMQVLTRLNIGGLPVAAILLTEGLRAAGFDCELVSGRVTKADNEGDMDYLARAHGVEPIYLHSLVSKISPVDDLYSLRSFYRLFKTQRPDVVNTHQTKVGLLARVAARWAGVPVIVHSFHAHALTQYFGRASGVYRSLECALSRQTTCVTALSPSLRTELAALGVAPRDEIRLIGYGLELAPFAAAPRFGGVLRRELGLGPEVPLVGFCGRLQTIKRPYLFVEAAARVHAQRPDAHFVMIGDGELRPAVERQLAELGLGDVLHLLGWRVDMPPLFADLDVLVNTAAIEGTPLVIMEAGAAGVPSVATRVGGCGDILADELTGWLVEPRDTEATAARVLEALADRAATAVVGARARDYFLSHHGHVERMVAAYADLYRELLERKEIAPTA